MAGAPAVLSLEPAGPEHPGELLLRTRIPEPRLQPGRPGTALRPPHPGSFVRHRDRLYEVVERQAAPEPLPHAYRLAPRDESSHTIRQFLDLDPPGLERLERELRDEGRRRLSLRRMSWTLPFVGLLPAHRLQRLEGRVGMSARHAWRVSSWCVLGASVVFLGYVVLFLVKRSVDRQAPGWWDPGALAAVAVYFLFESLLRLRSTEPTGSLPVALAVSILEETGLLELPRQEQGRRADRQARRLAKLVDRVRRVPAPGGQRSQLYIESRSPKRWPPEACILYEGQGYRQVASREEARGAQVIYHYTLEEADPEQLVRLVVPYRPDEAAQAAVARERRDFSDRLRVFKPLLGFLPAELQERWRREYGFDARGATLLSAGMELLAAVPNLLTSALTAWFVHQRAFGELVIGWFAALAALEGALRLRSALQGRPAGSILCAWVPWALSVRTQARAGGRRR